MPDFPQLWHVRSRLRRLAAIAAAGLALAGCAAAPPPGGPPVTEPRLTLNTVYTADGAELPLRSFVPAGAPRAVLIGVHGFNDYSNAFSEPGLYFMRHGVALYAYDQRGFGDAPDRGRWVGQGRLVADLDQLVELVHRRHPGVPVFILGESMGAAVAVMALTGPHPPQVDGAIMISTAVRGRATLTGLQRATLSVVSTLLPWFEVTSQGLHIIVSDNYTMLRQLSEDPLIIKATRTDTVRGLVDLMDAASTAVERLTVPTLFLSGQRDEIVTPLPTCLMLSRLPPRPPGAWRFVLYPRGYHMLLRDRDADLVMGDIERWIEDRHAALPSGDERLQPTDPSRPVAVAELPTCRDALDHLRDHPEFTALKSPP